MGEDIRIDTIELALNFYIGIIQFMKANIHPKYFPETDVVCSCGSSFVTGSTKDQIRVEICYKCHPIYTGEKRFMDSLGQVGKYEKKLKIAADYRAKYPTKKKDEKKSDNAPKSLKELLMDM